MRSAWPSLKEPVRSEHFPVECRCRSAAATGKAWPRSFAKAEQTTSGESSDGAACVPRKVKNVTTCCSSRTQLLLLRPRNSSQIRSFLTNFTCVRDSRDEIVEIIAHIHSIGGG